jgi:hypothetical protein
LTDNALTEDEMAVIFRSWADDEEDQAFDDIFREEYNLDIEEVIDALNRVGQEQTGSDVNPAMGGIVLGGILLGLAMARRIHEKESAV